MQTSTRKKRKRGTLVKALVASTCRECLGITLTNSHTILVLDNTERYAYSPRMNSEFFDFITERANGLHRYINFGKTSAEELVIYQASLLACLRLFEIAIINEKHISRRIRGIGAD